VQEGGGLYLVDSPIQLDNNILARNSAPIGNGIQMTGTAVLTGWHNTFVGSSGEGLRLSAPNSRGTLTNTIFANFTTGVNVQAGIVTLERTLWFSNDTNTIGVTPPDGNNPVYGDPAFRKPTADDYHITLPSAARDEGVPGGPAEDIDGDLRPCGPAPDIGADEITCICLPVVLKNYN
jgi:hypothetical protein